MMTQLFVVEGRFVGNDHSTYLITVRDDWPIPESVRDWPDREFADIDAIEVEGNEIRIHLSERLNKPQRELVADNFLRFTKHKCGV